MTQRVAVHAVRRGVQGRGCNDGLWAKVSLWPAFMRPANSDAFYAFQLLEKKMNNILWHMKMVQN